MDRRQLLPMLVFAFVLGSALGIAVNVSRGPAGSDLTATLPRGDQRQELEALRARLARLEAERDERGDDQRRPVAALEAGSPGAPGVPVAETLARLQALDAERFARLTPERLLHTWQLDLSGLAVTAEDLAQLAALPDLTVLDLARTEIGDVELKALAGLTGLESLNLTGAMLDSSAGVV